MDFQRPLSCQECHRWIHNYGLPTREESSYVRSMLRTSTRSNYQLNDPLATRITNWIILSETARIFDSLGLVDPVVLPAKLLLQALWQLEVSWDKSVSQDIYTEFKDYLAYLQIQTRLPFLGARWATAPPGTAWFLRRFGKSAYGTCVYLRAVNVSEVMVHLVCAKSRVTSLKTISLPHLEFCGVLLLSELVGKVRTSSRIKFENETN